MTRSFLMMGPLRVLPVLLGMTFLTSASCPESIKTHISYGSPGSDKELPDIHDTVISCPEIHTLDLKLSQGGCVVGDDPWNFQSARADKFSALKSLRLGGYNFDETQDRWLQQRRANRSIWRGIRDVLTDMTGISGFRPPQQALEPSLGIQSRQVETGDGFDETRNP